VRNIFALSSVLGAARLEGSPAENGRAGIELLKTTPDLDIVLMDIMMPEMDGYETMRAIRGLREFQTLPIIALTAKAMKGDREKCLRAGASDYVAKTRGSRFAVLGDASLDGSRCRQPVRTRNNIHAHLAGGPEPALDDDRDVDSAGNSVLLIVEDDPTFAQILLDRARECGFKALVALRGSTAITLARNFNAQGDHIGRPAARHERNGRCWTI